ncbi:SDR family NAD(P)-dependent oxidoreductase [Halioxenophilus aromaticivorans]|uniref:SDR family oxidoreductase n=1 Tax=Halioxenophilus aromaticivorans TaxID=1306992 RepID=A0AAV3U953_9ALTE
MPNVLIVGAGAGLSASLARCFRKAGYSVSLAARNTVKLQELADEIGAQLFTCDVCEKSDVHTLFEELDNHNFTLDTVIYNAGAYTRGPITEIDTDLTKETLMINSFGALLVAQQAAKRMLKNGRGAMLFTGASAGVKGFSQSAPFAMGKFALRGLCQSLARELAPQNVHVAHFIIDGLIYSAGRGAPYDDTAITLNPDEIAKTYLYVSEQERSAWTWELELRTNTESF